MSIPNLRMDGKVVLITGGRRGIGRALALAFAEAGADVATCSRTSEEGDLEALADQIRRLGRRALDAGAYGLVIPMVNSEEEATRAVLASRYPPIGIRSYGGPRVRLYGGSDYFEHANEEIAIIVQIEHINAVNHIDEILSVEGIDAFFIGPNDLAASMGVKLGLDNPDPRHIEVVKKVLAAGKKHHIPGGILVGSPEAVNQRIAQGFQFIALSSDEGFLRSAASAAFSKIAKERKVTA